MDRQTLRDWVHRFNAAGPEGLIDNWTEGPKPRLSAGQWADFAAIVEAGPDRERDGVVRWRRNWEHVIPFFAFPVAVRRIIYTTNAIESLNAKLRRAVRTRGHCPTDDAAIKLLYLVLRQVAQTWKMPPREWCEAKTQFAIMFDDRFAKA